MDLTLSSSFSEMELPQQYYCYILYSSSFDKYYIGYSQDPQKRLSERHNKGLVASTRNYRPYNLIRMKGFETELEAKKEELTHIAAIQI
ncbi:MAG: GIY-YIG nuclease family protein [Saprospiraceae bacterium]